MTIEIKVVETHHEPILWEMLYEAAHMRESGESIELAKQNPDLARYVADWGQANDVGYHAVESTTNKTVGAAWFRLLNGDKNGYGFVDAKVPELAIGVLPNYTGQGIGTQLMEYLISNAKQHYPGLSLNVRMSNPALRLYERLGFQRVEGSDIINRVGEKSFNMVLWFRDEQ